MKKLLFFLPLFLLAEVNPFDVKINQKNYDILTPDERAILSNKVEINKLKEQVSKLQKEVEDLKVKLVSHEQEINSLNTKLQGVDTILQEVDSAQNNVNELKKDLNETKTQVNQLQAAIKQILKVQEQQNQNILSLKESIQAIINQLKQREISPKTAMKKAKEYYFSGKLDKAKELFLYTLSKKYLPATSSYYLGEIAFKEKKYDTALGYYKKSVEYYSKPSSFTPRLLFHTGVSFEKLGDKKSAEITFKKLIHDFPKSKYAELAKKELEKLQ